jgi:hypothetical protein
MDAVAKLISLVTWWMTEGKIGGDENLINRLPCATIYRGTSAP